MTDRTDERAEGEGDRVAPRVLLGGASDERLVALARAGDEQAFAAIFERYRGPLLRYCRGFVSPAVAEDALQQTFINAYAALSGEAGRAPVSLRPWLYRIAHNAALNLARDPQAGLEQLPESLDGVERPDEVVQRRERLRRVVGAVTALPPKQRQVIVRAALDGDSHERIATDLGMSAGAIRQLAHRARRTVREAAAALLPAPLLRLLPWSANVAEAPLTGGGAALAKVAVAAVVMGAAGGGAVEVAEHGRQDRKAVTVAQGPGAAGAPGAMGAPAARGGEDRPSLGRSGRGGSSGSGSGSGSSGRGSSGSGSSRSGSSGSGSSGSGSSRSGSSGSGSSGSGSSGSGSSGSGSSGSGSSGSGSSGSGSSGSGSSGSGSGSGSSGSGSSGSGSSGSGSSGSGSSGSGSSGSGSSGSGSSGSGSSGSGSSGSGSSGSGALGSGSSGTTPLAAPAPTPDSSGSGSGDSSGSGSSGSGSDDSSGSGSSGSGSDD